MMIPLDVIAPLATAALLFIAFGMKVPHARRR